MIAVLFNVWFWLHLPAMAVVLLAIEKVREDWYARHHCTHAHCPRGCDKPQPFETNDGRLLCSRCWVQDDVQSEMIPCTPDICD